MTAQGVDALLFDLGNVVIDIDFNRAFARWAAHAGCDVAQVRTRFCVDEACKRHEIGAISDGEYFASLRDSLGITLSDAHLLDGWNAIFIDEAPGIAQLLARAAARLPVYCFSNTNPAHEAYWSTRFADTIRHFRKIYVSSTIGLRKPDAAAFRFVSGDIGVPPGRILFFDDSLANVEGARACGLQAVHVRAPSDIAAALAPLVGPPP
jgi:glucose-1-phosphatase